MLTLSQLRPMGTEQLLTAVKAALSSLLNSACVTVVGESASYLSLTVSNGNATALLIVSKESEQPPSQSPQSKKKRAKSSNKPLQTGERNAGCVDSLAFKNGGMARDCCAHGGTVPEFCGKKCCIHNKVKQEPYCKTNSIWCCIHSDCKNAKGCCEHGE